MVYDFIGWTRDDKGRLQDIHFKRVCNTITSFCGGGAFGGNTAPHVRIEYEL